MVQKKIVIYKGVSQYQALRVFADELADAFRKLGAEVLVLDFEKKGEEQKLLSLIGKQFDLILSMNGLNAELKVRNGEYLHDLIDAPFYAYIVDHPLYHHARLLARLRNYHVICVDTSFETYIKKYYPHIKSAGILLQGGLKGDKGRPFRERSQEVVFMGTYRDLESVTHEIEAAEETIQGVVCAMIELLLSNPDLTLEGALEGVLKENEIVLSDRDFADTMNAAHLADKYIRTYFRRELVKMLVESGIPIHVYGNNWERLKAECSQKDKLLIHPPVRYRETLSVYQDAKIVLNIMPWSKNGIHDRLINSMASGAVCVTDESSYILSHFKTGPIPERFFLAGRNTLSEAENVPAELFTFSLKQMEQLPYLVKKILAGPELAGQVAESGRNKVRKEHSWEVRSQEILDFFSS